MPLIKRSSISDKPVEVGKWKSDPRAVMGMVPTGLRLHLGEVIYGASEPKAIPTDDVYTLLRTSHDPSLGAEQAYRDRVVNRGTAIRGFCVLCQGGSPKAVRLCDSITCPLWAFRMGGNPLIRRK